MTNSVDLLVRLRYYKEFTEYLAATALRDSVHDRIVPAEGWPGWLQGMSVAVVEPSSEKARGKGRRKKKGK